MRRAALSAVLLGAAFAAAPAALLVAPREAVAQDKDDRKRKDEKERKKKEKREAAFKAIGADFAAKDVAALLGRVAKGKKVTLDVGKGDEGQYSVDQAKSVLREYFDKQEEIAVSFARADDNVGSFKMTVRRKGEDAAKQKTLQVTVDGPDADGAITLTKLAVSR